MNLRVARYDGKNKNIYASTVLPIRTQQRFTGQDGAVLTEQFRHGSVELGTYFQPESSTFPTYDAITTVPGEAVGLPDQKSVALLLQMTVSGASGLRRLPKHSVKSYVRHDLENAVHALVKDFEGPCTTAFCVPAVCFQPFLFQLEECKETDTATKKQPSYQFVIEIPDFIKLPKPPANRPLNIIHGASGQVHRYELRSTRPSKKQKSELHMLPPISPPPLTNSALSPS